MYIGLLKQKNKLQHFYKQKQLNSSNFKFKINAFNKQNNNSKIICLLRRAIINKKHINIKEYLE